MRRRNNQRHAKNSQSATAGQTAGIIMNQCVQKMLIVIELTAAASTQDVRTWELATENADSGTPNNATITPIAELGRNANFGIIQKKLPRRWTIWRLLWGVVI